MVKKDDDFLDEKDDYEKDDYSDEVDSDYDDLDEDFYGEDDNSPLTKHNDLLKQLTNFDPYLRDVFNSWLGLSWSEEEEKYTRDKNVTPIMSLKAAAWCVSFLKTYTRENNIITDIGREEYKFLISDVIDVVWLNLGTRRDLGVLKDGDLIRVCTELEHAAQLVLMGAGDGKYNKFLGTTITRHETIRPDSVSGYGGYPVGVKAPSKGLIGKLKKALVGE